MKIVKIIQNTFITGKLLAADDSTIEVEDSIASILVNNSKAEYCKAKLSAIFAQAEAVEPEDVTETKKAISGKRRKNHEDD